MSLSTATKSPSSMDTLSFTERAKLCSNKVAKELFLLMDKKQTNLCFNPDVSTTKELLELADKVGPYICVLKTHVDILEDFSSDFVAKLLALSEKHEFMIFEDRKFADIGNTVKMQYEKGIYHIANWAHITNAHIVAGPGTVEGLKEVGLQKGRALLLLAEMSSKGNMATGDYTKQAVALATEHPDFIIGFIAMRKLIDDPKFIHFTPGVKKEKGTDTLGQRYKTPTSVILENKSDIIIVGRGIYQASDPEKEAKDFARLGFEAYKKRLM